MQCRIPEAISKKALILDDFSVYAGRGSEELHKHLQCFSQAFEQPPRPIAFYILLDRTGDRNGSTQILSFQSTLKGAYGPSLQPPFNAFYIRSGLL